MTPTEYDPVYVLSRKLGRMVWKARHHRDLAMTDLAARAGINTTTVWLAETKGVKRIETFVRLMNAAGYDVEVSVTVRSQLAAEADHPPEVWR